MCRPATCKTCGKTTWTGCGQHADQVMAAVSRANRCPGHRDASKEVNGQRAARPTTSTSFLGRLLGR